MRMTGTAIRISTVGLVAAALAGAAIAPAQALEDTGSRQACYNAVGSTMNGWTRIPTVTLRQGSSGICVRELQEDLASFGIPDQYDPAHFIDGQFGPNTEAMLKDVQAQTHVAGGADGVVGRNTWTMLIATTSGD